MHSVNVCTGADARRLASYRGLCTLLGHRVAFYRLGPGLAGLAGGLAGNKNGPGSPAKRAGGCGFSLD